MIPKHMPSLGSCQSSLSHLIFAVKQALPEFWCEVRVEYNSGTGLHLTVRTYGRHVQRVKDVLLHGVLVDEYDYRFRGVMTPGFVADHDFVKLSFWPNFEHDEKVTERRSAKDS